MPGDEPATSLLDVLLKTVGVRINLPWGWADASAATGVVRVGDRLVPNRIDVEFPGRDGQPALSMILEVVDGIPQCRDLRLTSVPGGRAVRQVDLKAIHVGDWSDEVFAEFAMEVVGAAAQKFHGGRTAARQSTAAVATFQRSRQRKITPQLLAEAARIYGENFDSRPIEAVAVAFDVSERTASDWITRARKDPSIDLPLTTRGKKAK
jgi:hypothetical protein